MCDNDEKRMIDTLERIEKCLWTLIKGRSPMTYIYNVSASKSFVLDYKDRKHIYIWTAASGLSLNMQALGTLTIPQYAWTLFDFIQGQEVNATSGIVNDVTVLVRCTDELIA